MTVVVKNPSDFVGSAIGQSEQNTKGILASTLGKILVIDEAYRLFAGGTSDVQITPGEDRCVLLLGYKEQMEQMFQNVNPGLSRRFPMEQAFVFEDFISEELNHILGLKLKEQGNGITNCGRRVALEMLEQARNRPHFGNAGEIDILLNSAKMCHQKRLNANKQTVQPLDANLDAPDFDDNFDRMGKNDGSSWQLNMDVRAQLPFNFIFRGPPVIETSATDLVGQYVSQMGPKTQKVLEQALGKVLFIDEAYRLAEGDFSREAVDELVDCITTPRYAQKLIIILAEYDADINHLMSINSSLRSRFPESIQFEPLPSSDSGQKRDVGTLAKAIFAEVFGGYNGRNFVLAKAAVLQALNNMLFERS
ncbi:hypothetical protein N7524_011808 [Penicillium chrysogenum]|nr:hypothetical protein N7524_011808 [Penicillium chrysogenum]